LKVSTSPITSVRFRSRNTIWSPACIYMKMSNVGINQNPFLTFHSNLHPLYGFIRMLVLQRVGLVQAVESYRLCLEGPGFKSRSPRIAQARVRLATDHPFPNPAQSGSFLHWVHPLGC
jgi:hypothetical protein